MSLQARNSIILLKYLKEIWVKSQELSKESSKSRVYTMKHILNDLSINLVKSMKIDQPIVIIMIQKVLMYPHIPLCTYTHH